MRESEGRETDGGEMKTLDEVIKVLEDWEPDCDSCLFPDYCKENDCVLYDALKYLREYREDKQIYAYDIARRSMELAENNDPLTWDELKQMVGKPVWIDSVPQIRRWVIIKKFLPVGGNKNLFEMEVRDGGHFFRKNMKKDDPAWWQAYRKERK